MNEYDLIECLEAYAWKMSEVIQALPKCPHKASGQCAVCMDIQTRLGLISIQLGADPDAGLGGDFQQNALLVVRILRDMCSWPRVSNWELSQGNYQSISDLRGFVDDSKNLAALRKGIVAYLRQPSFVLRGLSSKCEELLDQFQTDDSDDLIESPEPEDLSTVHRKSLPLLRTYAACDSCQSSLTSQEGASWHPSRLVLTGPKRNGDDTVRFDVITSSIVDYSWQDVYIDMPILSGNPIDLCQDNTATDGRCCEQKLRMDMEPLTTFCDFFQHDDGCRIALKLEDGVLLRLGAEALKHRTTPGKGLALADVLDQYELSIKERLALAHAICLAFWQFYDSELMHRPWNSQTIWFMPEPDLRGNSEKLPLKVYISFHPEATECAFDSTEFATTKALIHRCPRIQALAILLL
ncbi:hypothetical protein CFRS1_v001318 [Colletotrichum fructicola]|nr:hypothetical protein CFRS1_v001318 [Colletotrichum fructicola]